MLKVAITGNIASGKSEVAKILLEMGYKHLDSDKVVHELLKNDNEVKNAIINDFDTEILDDESGNISRKKLAQIVFNDKTKLKHLEDIIHPKVFKETQRFLSENINEKIAFVSVPQLFETNSQYIFDKIVLITSPDSIRRNRLMKRNNLSPDEADIRIKAQESEYSKIQKSDFIIKNDSDLISLKEQVISVINRLLN